MHLKVGKLVRKTDGQRKKSGTNVWILVRRYEWEEQSQQTEYCDTFAFATRRDALLKAKRLLREDMRKHADGGTKNYGIEAKALEFDLVQKYFPRHLVQLTDADNVVFELYKRTLRVVR